MRIKLYNNPLIGFDLVRHTDFGTSQFINLGRTKEEALCFLQNAIVLLQTEDPPLNGFISKELDPTLRLPKTLYVWASYDEDNRQALATVADNYEALEIYMRYRQLRYAETAEDEDTVLTVQPEEEVCGVQDMIREIETCLQEDVTELWDPEDDAELIESIQECLTQLKELQSHAEP